MVIAVAFVALPAIASAAGISGQWDFNNGDLTATVGSDMAYVPIVDPGGNVSFGTDTIGGQTANVVNFDFTDLYDRAGYFDTPHGILDNGGGAGMPGGFAQVLTETLTAGMTYTLTAEVGNTKGYNWAGYKVQLLAGGTPFPAGQTQNPLL